MGLLSDGGVHSHINHLEELLLILSEKFLRKFIYTYLQMEEMLIRSQGSNI